MKVTIEIQCDGAAFGEDHTGTELARILREYADRVNGEEPADRVTLRDINGNTVGRVDVCD